MCIYFYYSSPPFFSALGPRCPADPSSVLLRLNEILSHCAVCVLLLDLGGHLSGVSDESIREQAVLEAAGEQSAWAGVLSFASFH